MFDILDAILLIAVAVFGVSGYRQGFVVGALSFTGFIGGAFLGAKVAPSVSELVGNGRHSPVTGIVVVFAGAIVGRLVGSAVAAAVRTRIPWQSARTVDAIGGAVSSGISVLLVGWLIATAVSRSPYAEMRRQVHGSGILRAVDAVVPDSGRRLFAAFVQLVDQQGFPQVFAGLGGDPVATTRPPDPALATSAVVARVKLSVLKVTGAAPACQQSIEGSSFVTSPQHVMTNAHVVAGVPKPAVEVDGVRLPATTVLFDPRRDVAVLYVPQLRRTPLAFASAAANSGDPAIVLGYPNDGPFSAGPARVRERINARGFDIYATSAVDREVYALRGSVRPGIPADPC